MATQIKLRRDTTANWALEDPVLAQGEPGYDTDTGELKIGDGSSAWTALTAINTSGAIPGAIAQDAYEVSINTLGNVSYPGDITQSYQDGTVCNAGVDTVIYTATAQYQHAIKLFVMVEGLEDGGGPNWETQACDIIAVKGYTNNIVHVTAYGVTYSGAAAIATFDGQWNATSNRIEITCRPVSASYGVEVSVHAIEMTSND